MTNSSEVTSDGPTDQHDDSAKIQTRGPGRGFAWAVAAFVVLAIGGLYFAFSGDDGQVVDQTTVPTPTTVPSPEPETMTDLETIEAGVAALYSGDADRAVELFELQAGMEDVWIRSEAPYQAAIGGRLTLDCSEQGTPGVFDCLMSYGNVFTEAIGWVETPEHTLRVVVEAGVITDVGLVCQPISTLTCGPDGIAISIFTGGRIHAFPVHYFIDEGLAGYLKETGYDNPDCVQRSDDPILNTPPSIECVQLVLDDLDGWAAWSETNLQPIAESWGVTLVPPPTNMAPNVDSQMVDQTTVPSPTTVLTPASDPTRLPERGQEPIGALDPGVYFLNADGDPSATTRATFVIEGPGWMGSSEGASKGALSLHLHQPDEPSTPRCNATVDNSMTAESTAADLADGFAASGFTIREAPGPVSAFGHDGYHVVVEVPQECDCALGWQWNIFLRPGDVMEAWIFDIDGHIVLVEAMWRSESPGIPAELEAVIDTLVLTP